MTSIIGKHFEYKKGLYLVIDVCSFKNPETRKWVEAVMYCRKGGQLWVRERQEFLTRFEEVKR